MRDACAVTGTKSKAAEQSYCSEAITADVSSTRVTKRIAAWQCKVHPSQFFAKHF